MVDAVSDSPAPATPGRQLAEARERQGLSRAEVAQRLHMSPWQVEALEAGEYERLPKGTFLRGFIRNYAKLVGMESEPLVASLAHAAPAHATPGIVVPSQNIRFEPLHERISASPYWKGGVIAAVVLAFGAAALYWWAEIRNAPAPAAASSPAKPAPPTSQQIAAAPLPAAETPPPTEAPKVEPPKAEPARSETPAPPPGPGASKPVEPPKSVTPVENKTTPPTPAAAPAGSARLAFRFRGDSWVEVKDASGKIVFSRLNTAGSEAEVTGKRPLTVVVGNAPDVTMLYNDREFPLEPHTRVAVARFSVE